MGISNSSKCNSIVRNALHFILFNKTIKNIEEDSFHSFEFSAAPKILGLIGSISPKLPDDYGLVFQLEASALMTGLKPGSSLHLANSHLKEIKEELRTNQFLPFEFKFSQSGVMTLNLMDNLGIDDNTANCLGSDSMLSLPLASISVAGSFFYYSFFWRIAGDNSSFLAALCVREGTSKNSKF
ncbi:hypothetical protein DSO57_1026541 [Entomophthora muscae]|uniref:Uncharacterized protein n=1 Tax=Entomophthora muscae TaxID=34485 RepID=A0ACC2U0K1_9FUNG|nr:hypothetical protein DSO57_1026541 [Entomophthora muscae]